jgi:tetratricopeptide (TPR) repeat protein
MDFPALNRKSNQPSKQKSRNPEPAGESPQKPFCFSRLHIYGIPGVLALLLAGGIYFGVIPFRGLGFFPPSGVKTGDAFYQGLAEFDALLIKTADFDAPDVSLSVNRALNALEKKSFGVESSLSLLKRRRFLARKTPRFLAAYQKAVHQALDSFPFSEPIVALAAEELVLRDTRITEDTAAKLTEYASQLTETRFKPMALSIAVLAGAFQNPHKAASIPSIVPFVSAALPCLPGESTADYERLQTDLAKDEVLIRILQGDAAGAATQLNELLQTSKAQELRHYAAEFFYDYDNPLRAAELFSPFSDEKSVARQADALWLAGHSSGARNLWTVLVSPEQSGTEPTSWEIKALSLYNLAVTGQNPEEGAAYLERLLAEAPNTHEFNVYGLIRYTRLLDTSQSIRILEQEKGRRHPLIDLELLRRRRSTLSLDRAIAETWLLLNRYPTDERLYRWGAYFFDHQRQYTETALLIKNAGYHQIKGSWLAIHDSLNLLMEGRIDEAEERLTSISPADRIWQISANMGLLLEARRAPVAALEYYQTTTSLVTEAEAAAKLYFRIGHCLHVLGRDQESRQALERALELNPNYLNARLELRRLNTLF